MHPLIDHLPHVRAGWGRDKVAAEQIRRATTLVQRGVQIVQFPSQEVAAADVADLNTRNIDGSTSADNLQGAAAVDHDGSVIGAVTVGVMVLTPDVRSHERVLNCLVRYLAVEPGWRHQGLATLLLCVMDQQWNPGGITHRVYYGGCTPEASKVYQRAGFDVLHPGIGIPGRLMGTGERGWLNSNTAYPCTFIRTWSPQAV